MEWLKRYVPSGRPPADRVYQGEGRSVATDAKGMICVADATASFAPLAECGMGSKNAEIFSWMINSRVPDHALHTTIMDLWLWLGHMDRELCMDCGAKGYHEGIGEGGSNFPCPGCNAKGWVFPDLEHEDDDVVVVCGKRMHRNLLVWWLAPELAEIASPCRIFALDILQIGTVVIDGGQWRVVCAARTGSNVSDFRTYVPGAGLWWSCWRDPVARLTAMDWMEEQGMPPESMWGKEPAREPVEEAA